jgi:TolB protein
MKQVFILGATALALILLVGCGSGGGGECTTPTPTPTPSLTPSPTPTPSSNITRRIVFSGGDGIYIMNADATNRIRLTTEPSITSDVDPALSPDSTQVTFVRFNRTGSTYQLILVNADGTNLRSLTKSVRYLRAPSWHPDGTRIAYGASISSTLSGEGIFTIKADGTEEKRLIEAGLGVHPSWSPDGKKIMFVSYRAGTDSDIYTMNVDGSELIQVTNTDDYSEWVPRWSPDGRRIVSYGDYTLSADHKMYILNMDGSGRMAIGPENARRPSWSPDGTKILFNAPLNAGNIKRVLFMTNSDGSDLYQLTNSSDDDPSWQ